MVLSAPDWQDIGLPRFRISNVRLQLLYSLNNSNKSYFLQMFVLIYHQKNMTKDSKAAHQVLLGSLPDQSGPDYISYSYII